MVGSYPATGFKRKSVPAGQRPTTSTATLASVVAKVIAHFCRAKLNCTTTGVLPAFCTSMRPRSSVTSMDAVPGLCSTTAVSRIGNGDRPR